MNVYGHYQLFEHNRKKNNLNKNYIPWFDNKNMFFKKKIQTPYESSRNKLMLWAASI